MNTNINKDKMNKKTSQHSKETGKHKIETMNDIEKKGMERKKKKDTTACTYTS